MSWHLIEREVLLFKLIERAKVPLFTKLRRGIVFVMYFNTLFRVEDELYFLTAIVGALLHTACKLRNFVHDVEEGSLKDAEDLLLIRV